MTREELIQKATDIGIKVDKRWSDAKLIEKIADVVKPPKPAQTGEVELRLFKSVFLEDDTGKVVRHMPGFRLTVPENLARTLISMNKARRYDPLIDEEDDGN